MKLIRNARIVSDDDNVRTVNILYDDRIREISTGSVAGSYSESLNLEEKLLLPGCIDPHVHFNDPGFTHRESFSSGTSAAACGGFTTIIDMPCTSIPPVVNPENLRQKLEVIAKKAVVDYALWGGVRANDDQNNKSSLTGLWHAGVVGFKVYTISGMDSFRALSYGQIAKLLAANPGILFAFHAEDERIISRAATELGESGLSKVENYCRSRPEAAEYEAVSKIIAGAAKASSIHFVHISTGKAASYIIAQKKNLDLSFETCPHYLEFTCQDLAALKGKVKTAPPVRKEEDRQFLRSAFCSGLIDFIATDHAGCDFNREKHHSDFSRVYNGIPGTELCIPYLYSEFFVRERISPSKFVRMTSENAARRFGLFPRKGSLQVGTDADFTVIDPGQDFRVDENKLHSLGKYSPLHGRKLKGAVDRTIVRGNTVFSRMNGYIGPPGYGTWIRRSVL